MAYTRYSYAVVRKNNLIYNVNGDESKTAKSLKGDISHHHIAQCQCDAE